MLDTSVCRQIGKSRHLPFHPQPRSPNATHCHRHPRPADSPIFELLRAADLKKLLYLSALVATIVIAVFLCLKFFSRSEDEVRELTIRLLQSIPQACLILATDEQVALPVIDNGNWLFGPRRGQASVMLRSHWGLDLRAVTPGDVEVSGSKVRIRLHEPSLFDTAADLSSWHFTGRRSGLRFIGDILTGRSLESDLLQIVHSFQPQSSPSEIQVRRQAFVDRLNGGAAELFRSKRLSVEFY